MKKTPKEDIAAHREQINTRNRTPTEMQQEFLDLYVSKSQDATYDNWNELVLESFREAGYDASNPNAMHRARKILERHWDQVAQRIHIKIQSYSLFAADTLMELCQTAKNESVRMKCATEILNKAGFKETDKLEVSEKAAEDMTHEERQKEIQTLMRKHGLKVAGSDVEVPDTEEV